MCTITVCVEESGHIKVILMCVIKVIMCVTLFVHSGDFSAKDLDATVRIVCKELVLGLQCELKGNSNTFCDISLMVNLYNSKFSWSLPNHIPTGVLILANLSQHLRDCIAFTSKTPHVLTIRSFYCEIYSFFVKQVKSNDI